MSVRVTFDVKQLVRVLLNDPGLRAEIQAALEAEPLPIRTACMNVVDETRVFAAVVNTDRDKAPGEAGFVPRDSVGWVSARLAEIITSLAEAPTLSADKMAEQMTEELQKRDKK